MAELRVLDFTGWEVARDRETRLAGDERLRRGRECYARRATEALRELLPVGAEIRLVADPKLDKRDRFGRLLRYVFEGKTNVNVAPVRQGAASVWFVDGDRGRYAKRLLRAAEAAQEGEVGLWGACPGTELDPLHGVVAEP